MTDSTNPETRLPQHQGRDSRSAASTSASQTAARNDSTASCATASSTSNSSVTTPQSLQTVASSDSNDRIFPVKSLVRVDSASKISAPPSQSISRPGDHTPPSYFPHQPRTSVSSSRHPAGAESGDGADQPSRSRASSSKVSSAGEFTSSPSSHGAATMTSALLAAFEPGSPASETPPSLSSSGQRLLRPPGHRLSGRPSPLNDLGLSRPFASPAAAPDQDHSQESLTTVRFKHVVTEDGHAIITGRDENVFRCEDEPIRAPGAIQGFGLLIVLREEEEDGRFLVRQVSETSQRVIGYTPSELFQLDNILDILSEEQKENLLMHIDFIKEEDTDVSLSGPEIFNLVVNPRHPGQSRVKLWCAIHINPAQPDLIVCEFEREDDPDYPFLPLNCTPEEPDCVLGTDPTPEELAQSTQSFSKPLRFPQRTRMGRSHSNGMQFFDLMTQIQDQLAETTTMDDFLKVLVGVVKEVTGYHRVMVYQFDSSYNGKVVTELVDPIHSKDLYYGLHFPASDIPPQARELYKINKMRLLYDRDLETARIVCRTQEDLAAPLDMTYCYLRAMSPIHLRYLANMAVRSSMSLSVKVFGDLWGLVSCHSYGSKGMRAPFPVRKMCRLISNVASRNIERLSYASSLKAQKLINSHLMDKSASGYIAVSSEELLKLFAADFGMVSILGETKTLGDMSQPQEALALVEYLRMRRLTDVIASCDILTDFPDMQYAPGFSVIAGMLYVPLSVEGDGFIVMFRRALAQEVKWGGNPHEKMVEGDGVLEPRASFKLWKETVTGRSREWTKDETELASVLCVVYGKFIQVWRQQEVATESSRLRKLLLANSAHQVRTPLNAIINYLEIALEGSLDKETRDSLAVSHSASKSLVYVINDLLDLTKTEEGLALTKEEIFDLPACIKGAAQSFGVDARRKGLSYEVDLDQRLPHEVYGDRSQVRQAIFNLVANAFQNTERGFVQLRAYVVDSEDRRTRVEISVQDSGAGMSAEQMDRLFRDLEQLGRVDEQAGEDVDESRPEGARRNSKLGLGLAVVARIVRNLDGQLRVKSEVGHGSCFVLHLPFDASGEAPPSEDAGMLDVPTGDAAAVAAAKERLAPPSRAGSYSPGEITLVGRGSRPSSIVDQEVELDKMDVCEAADPGEWATIEGSPDESLEHDGTPKPQAARPELGKLAISGSTSSSLTIKKPPTPTPVVPDSTGYSAMDISPTSPTKEDDTNLTQPPRSHTVLEDHKMVVPKGTKLQVLVAEDDPINLMVLKKRLEKAGHEIHHAVNGEDCATVYRQRSQVFDVILMDMQMPIMDGLASTQAIRAWERDASHKGLSRLARRNGRVPVFAVSASLVESQRGVYEGAGFDGWIPKPIDFERLLVLLSGIADGGCRKGCVYVPGKWEAGGWFGSGPGAESGSADTPAVDGE